MNKSVKIELGSEARIIQEVIHKRGHWGSFKSNGNSWIAYIIVVGIMVVSFLCLVLFG